MISELKKKVITEVFHTHLPQVFLSRILEFKNFMQQKRIFKNGLSQATEFRRALAEWPAISSPITFHSCRNEIIRSFAHS